MHFPGEDIRYVRLYVCYSVISKLSIVWNRYALVAARSSCPRISLHIVFDSCLEASIEAGERLRQFGGLGSVDLAQITANVPIPQQLDEFWTSLTNKTKLQQLARQLTSTSEMV